MKFDFKVSSQSLFSAMFLCVLLMAVSAYRLMFHSSLNGLVGLITSSTAMVLIGMFVLAIGIEAGREDPVDQAGTEARILGVKQDLRKSVEAIASGWKREVDDYSRKSDSLEREIRSEDESVKKSTSPVPSEYQRPTQREQLEYALVSGAASHLSQQPYQSGQIAQGIKSVLDALHPQPVLLNPHTAVPRDARDIASDPQAKLCVKLGEPLKAAAVTLPVIDHGPDSLEREIQAKASSAPRVTPTDIEAEISSEHYFTAQHGVDGAMAALELHQRHPGSTLANLGHITVCVLVLSNGTKLVGINEGPVSAVNFDPAIGRRYAREKAVDKIWPLLGFRLRDELARPVLTEADAAADLAGTSRPDHPTA